MNGDKNMSVGDGTVMVEDKIVFTGCKHAYLVMAHKDDETLRTLLRTLDDPRNDIFIHMDAKNTGWDENRALASIDKAGIFFVPRISVTWGGYSQIACELGLLNAAVDKGRYTYYHLLSGQDLPIKSQDRIHSFFDSCGARSLFVSKTTIGTMGVGSAAMSSGTPSGRARPKFFCER